MATNIKKQTTEEIERIKKIQNQELEREAILRRADEIKEETFTIDLNGQLGIKKEIENILLEQIDDPEAKYNLYYKVVNKLLRKHLPKGKPNESARKLIYEEKNTFLTRGHRKNENGIRGADGRMSYIPDLHELINIVTEWIALKGSMFNLYVVLRDLNISKGYGKPRI